MTVFNKLVRDRIPELIAAEPPASTRNDHVLPHE